MKKKILLIITIIVLSFMLSGCLGDMDNEETKIKEDLLGIKYTDSNDMELKYKTSNPVVALKVKKYGSIVIELYPDTAKNTVNNFIYLTKTGFYDNNTFHRLVPGFVLQGGDSTGTGTGDPGYSIKGEFSENGIENPLSHKKKVVSMARATDPDSGGCQFFIVLEDNEASLDNKYAAFGKVIDGWKNVENIVDNEKVLDSSTGKLKNNLTIEKAVVDLNNYGYEEPERIEK